MELINPHGSHAPFPPIFLLLGNVVVYFNAIHWNAVVFIFISDVCKLDAIQTFWIWIEFWIWIYIYRYGVLMGTLRYLCLVQCVCILGNGLLIAMSTFHVCISVQFARFCHQNKMRFQSHHRCVTRNETYISYPSQSRHNCVINYSRRQDCQVVNFNSLSQICYLTDQPCMILEADDHHATYFKPPPDTCLKWISVDNPMLVKQPAGLVFRWEYMVNVINRLGECLFKVATKLSTQCTHLEMR